MRTRLDCGIVIALALSAFAGPVPAQTADAAGGRPIALSADEAGPTSAQTGPLSRFQLNGSAYYSAGNSALDASPYNLRGTGPAKAEYGKNSFGGSVGGVLPWLKTTSAFFSYSGERSGNPFSAFATVPSTALRAGDFSGLVVPYGPAAGQHVTIYDPATGQPFPGNRIPLERMSPAALGLLQYMPLPNRDGMSQNFRFLTASGSRSDSFALRLTHAPPVLAQDKLPVRSNWNASLGFLRSSADAPNLFPLLGGAGSSRGWNGSLANVLTKGWFTNNVQVNFQTMDFRTSNHFRYDVAAALGVAGVGRDSFDWGLPAIEFSQFTGLSDITPRLSADRKFSISDGLSWTNGKHNLKWGGEFHRLAFDLRRSEDAAGSFVFTGFATAKFVDGVPVAGTGSDFADFLLGLPQKTHVQYSDGSFSFNGNAWSLYLADDWRLANNLTLNLGVRYEYVSPLSEAQNRLVTLDAPPDFSAIAVVRAGGIGPFGGRYPDTIVNADRNNFAPRIGVAWRAAERLIVRSGYSISYDSSLYNTLALQLSQQPPFAVGQTGIATAGQALTLANGFPLTRADAVANDFAVSRNLRLGYAQVWLLEAQNELPGGFVLVTSYRGTKGSHLPMLRAPNRTATGLLLPGVAPFLWQAAEGSSILHAGSLRVQKRLQQGLSLGASYVFSRSIDDVPALGGDTQVAQNDLNLGGDRGLSAFDQRHRVGIDYLYELPFGRGKLWLGESGVANRLLGDWSLSGTIGYGSGYPLTPHVVGDFADVAAGGYEALRPDLTGQPIALPEPTVARFFNTGAFSPPPAGQYGNAGRNTITGPATFTMDAAVRKPFSLPRNQTLEFHAQASNLLNTPAFTRLDTNLNSPSYGQITGVGSMRTIQLGLRYVF